MYADRIANRIFTGCVILCSLSIAAYAVGVSVVDPSQNTNTSCLNQAWTILFQLGTWTNDAGYLCYIFYCYFMMTKFPLYQSQRNPDNDSVLFDEGYKKWRASFDRSVWIFAFINLLQIGLKSAPYYRCDMRTMFWQQLENLIPYFLNNMILWHGCYSHAFYGQSQEQLLAAFSVAMLFLLLELILLALYTKIPDNFVFLSMTIFFTISLYQVYCDAYFLNYLFEPSLPALKYVKRWGVFVALFASKFGTGSYALLVAYDDIEVSELYIASIVLEAAVLIGMLTSLRLYHAKEAASRSSSGKSSRVPSVTKASSAATQVQNVVGGIDSENQIASGYQSMKNDPAVEKNMIANLFQDVSNMQDDLDVLIKRLKYLRDNTDKIRPNSNLNDSMIKCSKSQIKQIHHDMKSFIDWIVQATPPPPSPEQ